MRRRRSRSASAILRPSVPPYSCKCHGLVDVPELDFSTCWYPSSQLVVTTQCQVVGLSSSTRQGQAHNRGRAGNFNGASQAGTESAGRICTGWLT